MLELKRCLRTLRDARPAGYWAERILAQLEYMEQLYATENAVPPEIFSTTAEKLEKALSREGVITRSDALAAEEALSAYGEKAKKYTVICAAHAHIDMDWQWSSDETVGIVINTFQTMLDLMEEYPDFVYSQSQAAVYHMIEEYCPSMLPDIRRRVREGRWELTAAAWVEPDKNMPSAESQARHILYTKRYLSELFGVEEDSLRLDFEPDTFGHGVYVPELLQQGGIDYYYHCRGGENKRAYRWRAPSGKEVLAYCEPNWYLGPVTYGMTGFVPAFCAENHTDTAMVVYGVGDHGGGPTRRDLERIRDMMSWPLLPVIRFGRMDAFFAALEKSREFLPVVEQELNFVFTGCYTSQSRIKQANRHSEDRLCDSEALSVMAGPRSGVHHEGFEKAWRRTLFNQFHDILPGSCLREGREYALGLAQETNSYALANANRAMHAMGMSIDTSLFGEQIDLESTAEGAGAGYGAASGSALERPFSATCYTATAASRGGGSVRAFTIFNPTQFDREETVTLTVWDWKLPLHRTAVKGPDGQDVSFEAVREKVSYWQHEFDQLAFVAAVPSFGYANYYLVEAAEEKPCSAPDQPRVHRMEDGMLVLENELLRAEFSSLTMKLHRLTEKSTGEDLISGDRPAGYFRIVDETDSSPYSAWITGAYAQITDLNGTFPVRITQQKLTGVSRWISYEIDFRASKLQVRVILDDKSALLRYHVDLDWHETGRPGGLTPQLQLYVPYAYQARAIRYDVPGGSLDRQEMGHDVPAILYASPVPASSKAALFLTSDCKYGYRASGGALTLALLRSSHCPDKYPESGAFQMELGIGATADPSWLALARQAILFAHPLYPFSNRLHKGTLGQQHSFLRLDGRVLVSTLKRAEYQPDACVLRVYTGEQTPVPISLTASDGIAGGERTDITERKKVPLAPENGSLKLEITPYGMETIKFWSGGNHEKK